MCFWELATNEHGTTFLFHSLLVFSLKEVILAGRLSCSFPMTSAQLPDDTLVVCGVLITLSFP